MLTTLSPDRSTVDSQQPGSVPDVINSVRLAVENLRQADTISALVSLAPVEAARLGFERCLVSKISESVWVGKSAHAEGDDNLAAEMVAVSSRSPRMIDARLVEYDVVRDGRALLVPDAMRQQRVHPELARLVRPRAYVVAPIVVQGHVVGLIHADNGPDTPPVDEFSRDLLHMFSNGLSMVLETLHYREQLEQIRRQMAGFDSVQSCLLGDVERFPTARRDPCPTADIRAVPAGSERLTRRELEVLTHMADGQSNRLIASLLFVSEATVKAHVKHILRKLDAANRAEAVARYLRAS
jgi:DNA-binding CsgD family transcriptional regulator